MVRRTKEDAEVTRRHIIDAARRVFLECGVSHTTLEKIAVAAGVTRGAVYWHFRNKTELFFAMRDQAILPFVDRVLFNEGDEDPLLGIETALREIIHVLTDQDHTRETLEIVIFKCEYVGEFSPMMHCTSGQLDFLVKLADAYRRAHEKGLVRSAPAPDELARDTFLFVGGLVKHWLAARPDECFRTDAMSLIRTHIALRRA
ncbi:TetR family transcriptional regulator [Zoogloea sp.]|uniref:TetR family transcriptional regulator n=1 Tax=Zoogloea sp. TaxID=49181 RepID=UPI002619B6A2|nr:TetR family transcriptional regulator [Zoogloea sp.]MDD3352046.1 TetR family transcriptional regulator [Zoogloea sp.]